MRLFVRLSPCCTITNCFQAEYQWNSTWLGQMPAAFKKVWFPGQIYDFQDDDMVSVTCRTTNCRSVAPSCFVRKSHYGKLVILYAHTPFPPNPAPFTPATCPQCCSTTTHFSSGRLTKDSHHILLSLPFVIASQRRPRPVICQWFSAGICPAVVGEMTRQHRIFSL